MDIYTAQCTFINISNNKFVIWYACGSHQGISLKFLLSAIELIFVCSDTHCGHTEHRNNHNIYHNKYENIQQTKKKKTTTIDLFIIAT